MIAGQLLLAYHGCDITTRDDLVSGRLTHLEHSQNPYDWLGPGAYFFEGDVDRVLMFATASGRHPERMYTARPIATPAVVGAVLKVQHWLDMTTQAGLHEFGMDYPGLRAGLIQTGSPIPQNSAAGADDADTILRKLDNVILRLSMTSGQTARHPCRHFRPCAGRFTKVLKLLPARDFIKIRICR